MEGDYSESLAVARHIDARCDEFELALATGKLPEIESFLTDVLVSERQTLLLELLGLELDFRVARGEQPTIDDYANRFPELTVEQILTLLAVVSGTQPSKESEQAACTATVIMGAGTETSRTGDPAPMFGDQRLGRYRLLRLLGQGAFGRVWLGQDAELQRYVAIKVPTPERFQKPEDAEAYLAEARTVASLDHPHIVPVHDVGRADDGSIYVVSKFIPGCTLKERMTDDAPTFEESACLLATVAQALHHAHQKRLIHRDVKPANILLEEVTGKPYVADFGMAIREEDDLQNGQIAGTPAYMSPEQARGEGHRLDGRSDIFSLGVVFYELLTGKRPFRGSTAVELLHQVVSAEPVPPRELLDSIPLEMERICLKALSKRASDRYSTADELADDLLHWQLGAQQEHQERRIVPRGLRSFDADDADFFLDLLPGPRDRDGLPESIRFWKTRLEETDPDQTFSVGLIYGPSGCGKSSLVKAGLLPRLAKSVVAIYVEATPDDTETRILRGLRKQLPDLPDQLGLVETFALLRRGAGPKVVIVLDQFEQCLHAQRTEQDTVLVNALRQCNGGRLQAVVMVRDDFAMAAARFMDSLDIRIVQGHNFATVDLFDVDHARKVLIKFGQAFGKLPAQVSALSEPEREFVSSVATGLADDGQVVSVRLALFAEMIKSKPWTPATLEEVGGTAGVGVTFLEETFASRSANPNHRLHQPAAREVLKLLLPEVGTDIKGHMRSQAELMEAAGYQHRPDDFQDLLRILDGELRLITPTDPEGFQTESGGDASSKYYQFAHDYLVPSLRDWLTRKQKETPRGRAELLLEDRAAVWNARPENRQLPSLAQWFQIRRFTQKKSWTPPQRKMMAKAGRHHAIRSVVAALLLAVVTFTGLTIRQQGIVQRNATHAAGLMDSLLKADIAQVPAVVSDLNDYRQWSDPLLRAKLAEATDGSEAKLHMALALLPVDDRQIDYLREQLAVCTLEELPVVRKALLPHKAKLTEALWRIEQDESPDAARRFQAAAALAEYAPNDERWKSAAPFVAQYLTSVVSSAYLGPWRQLFQPARNPLSGPLTGLQGDRSRSDKQREAAVFLLTDYLRDQPEQLVELVLVADELAEFSQLVDALKPHSAAVRQRLLNETQAVMPVDLAKTNDQLSDDDQQLRDAHWKRRSLAAVTLVRLGFGDDVWSLLKFSPDPSLRSFIIHHLGKLGTDHNILAVRLERESDVSIRRALIQSLGGLDATRIPQADRSRIAERLQTMYVNDPDPGIHGSASWTLRKWELPLTNLPVGEPVPAEELKQRIAALATEVEELQHRIVASEQEVPIRQAQWERQLREQPAGLPPSLSEGLVAHYPLNETSGTETANSIIGLQGGKYAGPGHPEWIPGVIGNAVLLNGNGGHFTCGEVFHPDRTDSFSYGCWFLADAKTKRGALLAKFATADVRGFAFNIEPATSDIIHDLHSRFPKDALFVTAKSAALASRWHHLFVCYDGSSSSSGINIYLDGRILPLQQWKEWANVNETIQTSSPLTIGRRDTEFAFQGAIDDVRFYNRRLSDNDVHQLFESGLRVLAAVPAEARTPAQQDLLTTAYALQDAPLRHLRSQLARAESALSNAHWNGVRRWYVNGQGHTMVVIATPPEHHEDSLNRRIAISSHEVTVAEFRRFREKHVIERMIVPTDDCPVHAVSWFDAAEYCNWLCKTEGISEDQWIYEPNGQGKYAEGMKIKENSRDLSGYRIPTETEWEFACRSGAIGSYGFGESLAPLKHYGWHGANSIGRTHPVESLLPNDFGLFDLHGNLYEWTQFPTSGETSLVKNNVSHALRGGSFDTPSSLARSANRIRHAPYTQFFFNGFRVARTLPRVSANQASLAAEEWKGWPNDAPPPAIAPFDEEQAKQHQEVWAKHLGLPVEYTNSIGMKFRLIPPGEFMMGSTADEVAAGLQAVEQTYWPDCVRSESPRHKVVLTQPIYFAIHEVTQANYKTVMGTNPSFYTATGRAPHLVTRVAGMDTNQFPVEGMTWYDSAEFCAKLSLKEKIAPAYLRSGMVVTFLNGACYRLPTEAEWEFACRAGTTTMFSTGDSEPQLTAAAWSVNNSGFRPHAVGELSANPFGLHDMHGNVWEILQDWWGPTWYTQFKNQLVEDPTGPMDDGVYRISRGGSFLRTPAYARSAFRGYVAPPTKNETVGFRVTLSVAAVKAALANRVKAEVEPEPDQNTASNWKGWPKDTPPPAITPFDAEQAKLHQEAWTKHLNVPVEYTNSIGMKLRLIPPGEFTMGSTAEEIEATLKVLHPKDQGWPKLTRGESPQHTVILTKPFYLGVHEVTQAQYERVMRMNPSHFAPTGAGKDTVAGMDTASHPVEMVSWNEAAEFCATLSQQENLTSYYLRSGETVTLLNGTGYRLPTEAEWEFACRAGTTTTYWMGNNDAELVAAGWFNTNSGGRTHPVGKLHSNPFGICDFYGNVFEWIQDEWDPLYFGQFRWKPALDPKGTTSGVQMRMLRGGSWFNPASICRSSMRMANVPTYRAIRVGFRVALTVDAVKSTLK